MSSWASTLWWKRVTCPWTNVHFTYRRPHQYNHIHSTLHQQVQAVFVIIVRANGGATQELLAGVFGGQREVPVLLQVGSGNDGHQAAVFIHNRKFAWKRNMDSVADGFWWKTKHTKGCANKRVSKFLNIFTCANFIHGQDLRRQSVGVQVLNIYEGISPTTGLGCTLRLSQLFLQVRVRLDFCLCAKTGEHQEPPNQLHLSYSVVGFHWLLSVSRQQEQSRDLLALSLPVKKVTHNERHK